MQNRLTTPRLLDETPVVLPVAGQPDIPATQGASSGVPAPWIPKRLRPNPPPHPRPPRPPPSPQPPTPPASPPPPPRPVYFAPVSKVSNRPMRPPPTPPSPPIQDPTMFGQYAQIAKGMIVAVHLVHIPTTDNYFFMERPSGKHPDNKNFVAGVYFLQNQSFLNVRSEDSLFCAGQVILPDGNIMVVGGHLPKTGYLSGLKSLRIFNRYNNTLKTFAYMRYARWYPTATIMPDRTVFVMGGTQMPGSGTANNPWYEAWRPSTYATTEQIRHDPTFVKTAGDIYYPHNHMLPNGDLFVFCDVIGQVLNPYTGQVIASAPTLAGIKGLRTEYPWEAPSVLLTLRPQFNYRFEVVLFGGQFGFAWISTVASKYAAKIKIGVDEAGNYTFSDWEMEDMGVPRVMGDAVTLPNGYVIVLNGAQQGLAGDNAQGGVSKANEPALTPLLYNPDAPLGQRFSPLATGTVPRMYHSVAALTTDGRVFVAGCDRCDKFKCSVPYSASPTGLPEYRVEIFTPPFWYSANKPIIVSAPNATTYGGTFKVQYTLNGTAQAVTSVTIVHPSSSTHSLNNGQRVVELNILDDDGSELTIQAPPSYYIALPGYYMLFLMSGDIYSQSTWMCLGDCSSISNDLYSFLETKQKY